MGSLPRRITDPVFEHKSIRYAGFSPTSQARFRRKVDKQAVGMLFPEAFKSEAETHFDANERSLQSHMASRRCFVAGQWKGVRRWLQTCSEVDLEEWHKRWAYLPHTSCYAADAVFQIERRKAGAKS